MQVVMLPRHAGKTTHILNWMRAAPEGEARIGVFRDMRRSMELLRANPDLQSWQFVCVDELTNMGSNFQAGTRRRYETLRYAIDDIDHVLPWLLNVPIDLVTVTT